MIKIGLRNGRELVVNAELTSLSIHEISNTLNSLKWKNEDKSKECLIWVDLREVVYVVEITEDEHSE